MKARAAAMLLACLMLYVHMSCVVHVMFMSCHVSGHVHVMSSHHIPVVLRRLFADYFDDGAVDNITQREGELWKAFWSIPKVKFGASALT
jgi:hypothetical protein